MKKMTISVLLTITMVLSGINPTYLKIKAENTNSNELKLEAEDAKLSEIAKIVERQDASGGKKVGKIDNQDAIVEFSIRDVESDGDYKIDIVAASDYENPSHKFYVNDDEKNVKIAYYSRQGWDNWNSYSVIVPLKKGDNTIAFTHSGILNSFSELDYITFYDKKVAKIEGITIEPETLMLKEKGERKKLSVKITPDNLSYKRVIWMTTNKNIANINEEGEVVAVKGGKVAIKAISNLDRSLIATCQVTVGKEVEEIDKIKTVYEAEDAKLNEATVREFSGASNNKKVNGISNENATVEFTIKDVVADGNYRIDVIADSGHKKPSHKYYINGEKEKEKIIHYRPLGWDNEDRYSINVPLKQGDNSLTFTHSGISGNNAQLDCIYFYSEQLPEVEGITINSTNIKDFKQDQTEYEVDVKSLEQLPNLDVRCSEKTKNNYEIILSQPIMKNPTGIIKFRHKEYKELEETYQVDFYDENAFENPVVNFGADPYVTFQYGYYYYVRVRNDKEIYVFKSKELNRITQTQPHLVYTRREGEPSGDFWAPEIFFIDGHWYIYYTAGKNKEHRMYVLESKTSDALGEYVFKGEVKPTTERWAIDQTVLQHNGKLYAIWSGWEGLSNVAQNLYIAEMENPYTIKGERAQISRPEYNWETNEKPHVNEGPQILKSPNGVVNVIYSASGSWSDSYCLGRLILKQNGNPMNPDDWIKAQEPVFEQNRYVDTYSTGHASFVKSPDGSQDFIVYHATKNPGDGWDGRGVRVQKFTWNEDGTPNIGKAKDYNSRVNVPSGTPIIKRDKYEAEDGKLLKGAKVEETYNSSGGKKVTSIEEEGSGVEFNVETKKSGKYKLYIGAANYLTNEQMSNKNFNEDDVNFGLAVKVNNQEEVKKEVVNFFKRDNGKKYIGDNWMGYELEVNLKEGQNTIFVGKHSECTQTNLDYIELELLE